MWMSKGCDVIYMRQIRGLMVSAVARIGNSDDVRGKAQCLNTITDVDDVLLETQVRYNKYVQNVRASTKPQIPAVQCPLTCCSALYDACLVLIV